MLEFNLPYLNIAIDEGAGLMYTEWVRQPNQEEHKEGTLKLMEFLQGYAITYWIKDSTWLIAIPQEDKRWELRQVVPAIASSRLQKLACLITKEFDYLGMMMQVVEEEQIQVQLAVEVVSFSTYKEAADWLADIKA
jgi:hypothetical protein